MRHHFKEQEIQENDSSRRENTSQASLPTQENHVQGILQHFCELDIKCHGNQINIVPHDKVDQSEKQYNVKGAQGKQTSGNRRTCMISHQIVNNEYDHKRIQYCDRQTHTQIFLDNREEIAPG